MRADASESTTGAKRSDPLCAGKDYQVVELENAGFELLDASFRGAAKGWITTQHVGDLAYKMEIDNEVFASGKRSFRVARFSQQAFASVAQSFVLPGGTKELKIIASLRSKGSDGEGWVLFANTNGRLGILDQIRSDALIGDVDWKRVHIDVPITEGVSDVKFGGLLLGGGTGWIDDVVVCSRR